MKKIFISYSLKACGNSCAAEVECGRNAVSGERDCRLPGDQTRFVQKLVDCLNAGPCTFEVLWDRNVLYAGSDWRAKLYPCLGESHAAVILLGEGAFTSHYVPLESMVLMWRKILQANMLVVPVYFGRIDENRLKDPKSPFYGIGLEDVQAVKHHGDDADAIAEIEQVLGTVAEPPPLESIAMLHKLARLLAGADEEALKAAAEALGLVLSEWGAAKAMQLALSILSRGLGPSLNALNRINIENQQRREMLHLLAPSWVNSKAAAEVMRCGQLNAEKPILVINGNRLQTAEHYVSKAWSHRWEAEWGIVKPVPLSDGLGVGTLKQRVLHAFWLQFMDTSGGSWNAEAAVDALNVIKERDKEGQPVYVLFERAEGLDSQELAELQSELKEVTILYLAKQQPPKGHGFLEMTPELTVEAENAAFTKYQQAYSVLVNKAKLQS